MRFGLQSVTFHCNPETPLSHGRVLLSYINPATVLCYYIPSYHYLPSLNFSPVWSLSIRVDKSSCRWQKQCSQESQNADVNNKRRYQWVRFLIIPHIYSLCDSIHPISVLGRVSAGTNSDKWCCLRTACQRTKLQRRRKHPLPAFQQLRTVLAIPTLQLLVLFFRTTENCSS